jgi:hypothetical protein
MSLSTHLAHSTALSISSPQDKADMTTTERSGGGGVEWQNALRARLMERQAEGQVYSDLIAQCESLRFIFC